MKITLEPTDPPGPNRNPKVVIETDTDPPIVGGVIEQVVVPALLAWGFSQDLIDQYLDTE